MLKQMFKSKSSGKRRLYQVFRLKLTGRMPLGFLKWGNKMPSTAEYNLVTNDDYDTRIPLHSDEAFQYGISFKAKYIGTMEVVRPSSRVEIVAAMRRVRYEFKAKGVKKRKVTVDVSINGVRVTTRKKKPSRTKKLFGVGNENNNVIEIMHHPIYRIFYVSHDSSDLKIFSYIARDGPANVFKCNVFKSTKKSQAMRIVRTVGQAFEVCHKLSNSQENPVPSTSSAIDEPAPCCSSKDAASEAGSSSIATSARAPVEVKASVSDAAPARPTHLELLPPPPKTDRKRSPQRASASPAVNIPDFSDLITKVDASAATDNSNDTPLSAQHELQFLKERLEQQSQQTRAAVAQLLLLRDQLAAEQAARCEAQARTHQLLVHNKELLEHIASLVTHLQERERGSSRPAISPQQLTLLPQISTKTTAQALNELLKNDTNANKPFDTDSILNLLSETNNVAQNFENNNMRLSPFTKSPMNGNSPINGPKSSQTFDGMTNEEIQTFLIDQFQNMDVKNEEKPAFNNNQHYFQNSNAFPSIPILTNHYSDMDLTNLTQEMPKKNGVSADNLDSAKAQAVFQQPESSKYNFSSTDTSKDSSPDEGSSDDAASFIMPLSHNATLTATGEDGKVRLIVPVSPSSSSTHVVQIHSEPQDHSGRTLTVPDNARALPTTQPSVITRTTSEKVPNRSDLMAAIKSQWTRHTTK